MQSATVEQACATPTAQPDPAGSPFPNTFLMQKLVSKNKDLLIRGLVGLLVVVSFFVVFLLFGSKISPFLLYVQGLFFLLVSISLLVESITFNRVRRLRLVPALVTTAAAPGRFKWIGFLVYLRVPPFDIYLMLLARLVAVALSRGRNLDNASVVYRVHNQTRQRRVRATVDADGYTKGSVHWLLVDDKGEAHSFLWQETLFPFSVRRKVVPHNVAAEFAESLTEELEAASASEAPRVRGQ